MSVKGTVKAQLRPLSDSGCAEFDAREETLNAKLAPTAAHQIRAGESATRTASPGLASAAGVPPRFFDLGDQHDVDGRPSAKPETAPR